MSLASLFFDDFKKSLRSIKDKTRLPYKELFYLTADYFDDVGLCDIFDHPQKIFNGLTIYNLMDNETPLDNSDLENVKTYLKRVLDYERRCLWVDNSELTTTQRTELNNLIKGL